MKFDRHISDAAKAAGIKLLIANNVSIGFIDRDGVKRGFYRSAFGWVEAKHIVPGWLVTLRRGSGPLLARPVSGVVRGVTLDETAAGAADVFPSAVAVIRATMPAAVDVGKSSRLGRWFVVGLVAVVLSGFGGGLALASEGEPRFYYRYSSELLPMSVAAAPEGGEQAGEEAERPGTEQPGTGGETEPENPAPGDGEASTVQPSDIELTRPALSHLDMNQNSYADAGDIFRLRVVARNTGTVPAEGVRIGLEWPSASQPHSDTCEPGTLTPGQGHTCERDFYLTLDFVAGLGEPDAIATYSGFGALIGLGGDVFPADGYHVESNEISFMLPAPVTRDHIVISAPTLALLDADGDGSGDAGEAVRMTFKATNIGSGPAENVIFAARFPSNSADVRTCDFSSIASAASVTCQINFALTQEFINSLGEPGAVVSLDGTASLLAVNGLAYGEGEISEAFGPVGFTLPTPETVAYLRLTYSGGWIFECRTGWTAEFLADNLDMTMVFWNRVAKIFVTPGMDFNPKSPTALNLRSSWFQISTANYGSMSATVGGYLTPTGDPRGKQIRSSDGTACIGGKTDILANGDLATAHRIEIQLAEIVERVE